MGTAESLERARQKVEAKVLLDHCQIALDASVFGDDTFNTTTGAWSRPGSDSSLVYDGICAVKNATGSAVANIEDEGGANVVAGEWEAKILLLGSAAVVEGAILVVTVSRDPGLVGRKFKVDEVIAGTLKITRKLRLSSLTPSPRAWSDR